MWRVVFLVSLFLLSACADMSRLKPEPGAPPPPSHIPATRASAADAALAPFEDAALLPPETARLPYAEGRAYAVLVLLPSPGIVDLSTPEQARRGLWRFLNPLAVQRAGTALGHLMVGWRCANGQAGLVSKTGAAGGRGYRLLRQGWGLGALLASYDDGRLVPLADLPEAQRRAMRLGRARIVAMEISEQGCQRMRGALADYLAGPVAAQDRYSMVPTPARPLGDGCAGFALCLADRGGATRTLTPWLTRRVVLRDSFMGLGETPEPGITMLRTTARAPMPMTRLLLGDWSSGAEVGSVRMLDLELVQRALEEAEARAGYTRPQRLNMDDPTNTAAQAAIARWLDGWRRVTPVRMGEWRGGVRAVVLHRR
ncbi:MAG: hypothetical protein HLUCCA12_07675 [Rhodobacteraceae bacterium HLUCCA12]|nr:MAG: hypothetical protein HLUCCA12_07675 [Rhodobacteraceae bacterium HLUCCA12]